jgi:hypothetical protein
MKQRILMAIVLLAILTAAVMSVAYTFPPCKINPRQPACALCGPRSIDPRCPTFVK